MLEVVGAHAANRVAFRAPRSVGVQAFARGGLEGMGSGARRRRLTAAQILSVEKPARSRFSCSDKFMLPSLAMI